MKQTVFKHLHASFPPIFKIHNFKHTKAITWEVTTDYRAVYQLHDPVDQLDWNKVLGIKKEYFNSHYHSIMLAHRWNSDAFQHEWAYYIHDPKHGIIKPPENTLFFTSPSSTIYFSIHFWNTHKCVINIADGNNTEQFIYESSAPLAGRWWETNLWFGGNRRAPSNYSITKKRIKL
jgi:hypothetical protein